MGLYPPGKVNTSMARNASHASSDKLALTTTCCKRQSTCKMAALPAHHRHKQQTIRRQSGA